MGKVVVINMKDARLSPKYDQIFSCQRPVLFKSYVTHWRAMNWMKDLDSLRKRMKLSDDNDIVVPLEVGGSYMSKDMEKLHVGLSSLLDTVEVEMAVENEGKEEVGLKWYLAQLELKQISPVLLEDIEVRILGLPVLLVISCLSLSPLL